MHDRTPAIWAYIEAQLSVEAEESAAQAKRLARRPLHRPRAFASRMAREFWWSMLTHAGLQHLHDGSWPFAQSSARLHAFLASLPPPPAGAEGSKFYIEVSQLIWAQRITGIQRVAREYCHAARSFGGVPVFSHEERVYGVVDGDTGELREIGIAPGDRLLTAGAWWADATRSLAAMRRFGAAGGENILLLHDMFPLLYAPICHGAEPFIAHFDEVMGLCDAVVGVSQSVADEFVALMSAQRRPFKPGLRVGWRWHGADFSPRAPTKRRSPRLAALFADPRPILLSVGTLEPRKGYPVALDAMERVWRDGVDARYVIVGARGWLVSALERRLSAHEEFGRRLFWFDDLADPELISLYWRARALIYPSVAEGFGLPLVEATHFGLPVIASDIPVFRELANDFARFFDVADAPALADAIKAELEITKIAPNRAFPSWGEAMGDLRAMIESGAYQYGALARHG